MRPALAQGPGDLLAGMARGFARPVHDTQAVFRQVLEALSRPGRIQALPSETVAVAATALPRGVTALLLTLLDSETSLHLMPACASAPTSAYLRFHTGVREVATAATADFVVADAAALDGYTLLSMELGSDESPQQGATLIVAVESLAGLDRDGLAVNSDTRLLLTGPGIEHRQPLQVGVIATSFWQARIGLQAALPRGVDLLLVCGDQVVGLPRSTRLVLAH